MSSKNDYLKEYKKEHYAPIYMEVYPEEKESWKQAAKSNGNSLQGFVRETVNRRIKTEREVK